MKGRRKAKVKKAEVVAKALVKKDGRVAVSVGKGARLVGTVGKEGKKWASMGKGYITIDSAAEESVCPEGWCEAVGTKEVSEVNKLNLVNASGKKIEHYGEREVRFKAATKEGEVKMLGMGFQVAGVTKALAAVWRICDKGNIVQFGPEEEDNFILNKGTGAWEASVNNYEMRHGRVDDAAKTIGIKRILPEQLPDSHFRGKKYERYNLFRQELTN